LAGFSAEVAAIADPTAESRQFDFIATIALFDGLFGKEIPAESGEGFNRPSLLRAQALNQADGTKRAFHYRRGHSSQIITTQTAPPTEHGRRGGEPLCDPATFN